MVSLLQRPLESRAGRSLLRGLKHYWPLAFANGGVADLSDMVGGATLTDPASVTTVAGPSSKIARATQLTAASSQYLSRADQTSLRSPANVTWCCWCYWDGGNTRNVMSKFTTGGNQREWNLTFYTGTNRLLIEYSADGINTAFLDQNFVAAINTWYFVRFWTDSAAATINISYNNATPVSAAFAGPFFGGTAPFLVGALNAGTLWFGNGRVAGIGKWDRLLTRSEATFLYNGGQGRQYRTGHFF